MLFERGFHDSVLYGKGQLQAMLAYVQDNPRRLLIKRCNPSYFRQTDITIGGKTVHAYGNLALLQQPVRPQVKCSRSISDEALATETAKMLQLGLAGAVLVSPFISDGERHIRDKALEARMSLIIIVDNGFGPYYKPYGHYFETCALGRLLLLSPFDYHTDHRPLTRAICNIMNDLAQQVATE